MIDERYLADPERCPDCAARLTDARDACPTCALPLLGPAASQLWQLSVEASRLVGERSRLIAELRAEAHTPVYAAIPAAAVPPASGFAPAEPVSAAPEWTPRRVQNLLLLLGVVLLGVAAVIFLVVSWGRLGVGGRAAVMTGVTAIAAAAAWRADRRRLTATAEALSLLAVGLGLLDCAGAWAANLAGLRSVDSSLAAAGSAALVSAVAGASSHVLRTRSLRLAAALLGQLPVPFVAAHAAESAAQPAALLAAAAAAQAVAAAAVTTGWVGRADTRDARRTVGAGAGLAAAAATGLSLVAAYAEPGSLVVGTALLVVVALSVAVASELVRGRAGVGRGSPVGAVLQAAAAAILVAAVWAPVVDLSDDRWVAPQLAAAALVLIGLVVLVPASRRATPALVLLAASWLPAVTVGPALIGAVVGRLQWFEQPWLADGGSARQLLEVPDGWSASGSTGPELAVLMTVAVAAGVAPVVHRTLRFAGTGAAPAGAAAGLFMVTAFDGPHGAGVGVDLMVALLGTVCGAWLLRRGARSAGTAAMVSAAVVLVLAVAWSFAVEWATLAALPVAAVVLVAAVVSTRGLRELRGVRVRAAAGAVLLVVAEGAAVARSGGAGWPAVWVVASSLLVLSAAAAAAAVPARGLAGDVFWERVRRATAVVTASALLALTAALTWWQGAGPAGVGLTVCVGAAALLATGTVDFPDRVVPSTSDLRQVALAGGVLGLAAAGLDGNRLWLALLALGVGTAVLAVRVDHRAGWLSGVLLAASSWVRLSLSDVTAPEAYTVAPALALLVVGWRRRVSDPTYRSWSAYAPGLLLALGPSLLRAVTDVGDLRPLLLGLAALGVLAVGVWARLQAPLVLGAGTLAVDAAVQLAPYLVAVYAVVPRWVTIGAVGLLLLAAGATYEQRVRDLRRVGRRVKGLA